VTVTPCAQAPDGPCDVVAGQNATVTVDFTPSKSQCQLIPHENREFPNLKFLKYLGVKMGKRSRHGIYWAKAVDMQLKGMPKSACKGNFVNCTLAANVKRTYTAVIPLKPSFPKVSNSIRRPFYKNDNSLRSLIRCYSTFRKCMT